MYKKLFLIILTVVLLLSTSVQSKTAISAEYDSSKEYSGEEMFLAVVLGQGDLAENEYRHLWSKENFDINNSPEALEFGQLLVEEMNNNNPDYFSSLEKAAYSSDFIEAERVLNNGKNLFIDALENLGEEVTMTQEGDIQPASALAVVAFVYAAVVSTVAAGVTHAAGITFYLEAAAVGPGISSNTASYSEEQSVKNLIESVN